MRSAAALSVMLILLFAGCVASRSASSAPAPSALSAAVAAPQPRPRAVPSLQRAVAYPHGQWVLYGIGSTTSPYAWVWVPTGAMPPPAR